MQRTQPQRHCGDGVYVTLLHQVGWAYPTHTPRLSRDHTSTGHEAPVLTGVFSFLPGFLLACWSSNTSMAHLSIEALPPSLPEGGNVLIRADNQSEKPQAFFWYKGKRAFEEFKIAHYETASQSLKWGRKYSGRERIYTNGSLLLQNVTQEDTGIYTLESFDTYYQCEIAHVHLQVFSK